MNIQSAQNKIDTIMSNAYEAAFLVLSTEILSFLRGDTRFQSYHHMVGWGPSFTLRDGIHGIHLSEDMPTQEGRDIFSLCNEFYDTYGAGNEVVTILR